MSRIICFWKCTKCDSEFHQYVSFGHPQKDFIFKWDCKKCGHRNELLIKAFPDCEFIMPKGATPTHIDVNKIQKLVEEILKNEKNKH